MKTAISLPDKLFQEAERTAQSMGLPRSQLFARALEEFIEHHKKENVTEKLNQIYSKNNLPIFDDRAGIEAIRELTKNDSW